MTLTRTGWARPGQTGSPAAHHDLQGEGFALFHGLDAAEDFGRGEEVERADLVIGAPATPVFRVVLEKFGDRDFGAERAGHGGFLVRLRTGLMPDWSILHS
ncbi:MAG TPA: hypothetical protein PLV07_13290 [Acidiphilium sp.]|nr:hypothetical protein [Acidiphilium sp.]